MAIQQNKGPSNWLARYAEETWRIPTEWKVPSNIPEYLANTSILSMAKRKLLRRANFVLHRQGSLVRDRIAPTDRKILWIHKGMPQVGDSLMDLSARQLLEGRVDRLDLLTDEHLLPLYRADRIFSKVASSASALDRDYDLVLLHSASSYSVKEKFRNFGALPFAHIHGFFTGPDFNRTLFGFHRINQLLGDEGPADIESRARPIMWCDDMAENHVSRLGIPVGAVAVAVGGVRAERTFHRWKETLERFVQEAGADTPPIVLVGGANGRVLRDEVVMSATVKPLFDLVDQLTLPQVFALIRRCKLVIAADGGLMHVAHAADARVLALFAGPIDPAYRLTAANKTESLYGAKTVDDIDPLEIVRRAKELLNRGYSGR